MGQTPSNEEQLSVGALIDSVFADLRKRNIVDVAVNSSTSLATIQTEHLIPLGNIMANAARPEFGAANGPELFTLAQKAELDLVAMQRGRTTS